MRDLLLRDLWTPIWPNLVASAIWTWPLLAWHHRRIRRHIAAELRHSRHQDHEEAP